MPISFPEYSPPSHPSDFIDPDEGYLGIGTNLFYNSHDNLFPHVFYPTTAELELMHGGAGFDPQSTWEMGNNARYDVDGELLQGAPEYKGEVKKGNRYLYESGTGPKSGKIGNAINRMRGRSDLKYRAGDAFEIVDTPVNYRKDTAEDAYRIAAGVNRVVKEDMKNQWRQKPLMRRIIGAPGDASLLARHPSARDDVHYNLFVDARDRVMGGNAKSEKFLIRNKDGLSMITPNKHMRAQDTIGRNSRTMLRNSTRKKVKSLMRDQTGRELGVPEELITQFIAGFGGRKRTSPKKSKPANAAKAAKSKAVKAKAAKSKAAKAKAAKSKAAKAKAAKSKAVKAKAAKVKAAKAKAAKVKATKAKAAKVKV